MEILNSRPTAFYNKREIPDEHTLINTSEWQDLVDQMKAKDISPALIVLTIYVKAMDRVSVVIISITQESDKLSSVMNDLLSLSSALSKIQGQLGPKKEVTKEDWGKFDAKKHLTDIYDAYKNLKIDCEKLKEASKTQPEFKSIVTASEGVIDDFDTKIGNSRFSDDLVNWDKDPSFKGDKTGTLSGDVVWLAKQFYEKNHDTDDKGTVDYLSIWIQGINTAQQLGQGMSQQNTVKLQAQMQFVSSYNSSGQQTVQMSKQEGEVMVHNQAGR